MPFDCATAKPTLGLLAQALRDHSRWPEEFGEWDYRDPAQCAMGLAKKLWGFETSHMWPGDMAHAFGMKWRDAYDIFVLAHRSVGCVSDQVRPEHVADLIDRYLARGVLQHAV